MSSRKVAKDQRYGWLTTKKFVGGGKGGGKGPKWECVCAVAGPLSSAATISSPATRLNADRAQ